MAAFYRIQKLMNVEQLNNGDDSGWTCSWLTESGDRLPLDNEVQHVKRTCRSFLNITPLVLRIHTLTDHACHNHVDCCFLLMLARTSRRLHYHLRFTFSTLPLIKYWEFFLSLA